MYTSSKVLAAGVCALALFCNAASAQSDTSGDAKSADIPGLLGRDTIGIQAGMLKIRNEAVKPTGFTADTDMNLTIDDGFDYTLDIGFEHAAKAGLKLRDTHIDNGVTYYYRTRAAAPFISAGLGYDWERNTVQTVDTRSNHLAYEAATGVEVPVSKAAAVRLGVDFDESTRRPHERNLGYDVKTNYWFNDSVGASVGAVIRQGRNGAHDAALYTAGLHFSLD